MRCHRKEWATAAATGIADTGGSRTGTESRRSRLGAPARHGCHLTRELENDSRTIHVGEEIADGMD
jgi:hypothetical protein